MTGVGSAARTGNGFGILVPICQANALRFGTNRAPLGGSRPLQELFHAAGCKFEFGAKTIQPLTKLLREELEKL